MILPLLQLDRVSAQAHEAKKAASEGDQHRAQLQAQVRFSCRGSACDACARRRGQANADGWSSPLLQVTAMAAALKKAEDEKQVWPRALRSIVFLTDKRQ